MAMSGLILSKLILKQIGLEVLSLKLTKCQQTSRRDKDEGYSNEGGN